MITNKPTGAQVKAAREAARLTQPEAAKIFGFATLNGWQKKETDKADKRSLSVGEYNYLLLLANQHPEFIAIHKLPQEKNARQMAAQAALDLAKYLSDGDNKTIVLPTLLDAMMRELQLYIKEFNYEWDKDIPDVLK